MAWFEADILDFFAELELNNDRSWFEQNKKRYETSVKRPMEKLADAVISQMKVLDPAIQMAPKDALFRIYRDVRFSKDKRPYKTNAGLYVSSSGRDHHGRPGIYFHVDARQMGIASGFYQPEPSHVKALRTLIASQQEEFASLLNGIAFQTAFGAIAGEKGKILPAVLKQAAEKQPLIYNKQFYYWAEFDGMEVLREDLLDVIIDHYRAAMPMNDFLLQAQPN